MYGSPPSIYSKNLTAYYLTTLKIYFPSSGYDLHVTKRRRKSAASCRCPRGASWTSLVACIMDQVTDSAPAACASSMAPNSLRAPLLGLDGIDSQANITWIGRDRRRRRYVEGAEPIAKGGEAGDNFVREGTILCLKLSGPSSLDVTTAATNATSIEEQQREEGTSLMYDRTPDAVARDPGRRRRALSDTSNLYENHGPGSTHPRHDFKFQGKEAVPTPLKSTPDFLQLREPTEEGGGGRDMGRHGPTERDAFLYWTCLGA